MSNPEKITALPTNATVREWLAEQMKGRKLTTLLAFADDGVIWGRHDGSTLVIAHDVDASCTEMRGKTLQEAHAFNQDIELHLFRSELGEWQARLLHDEGEVIRESQILWGDQPAEKQPPAKSGFVKLTAERKGIPEQVIPDVGKFDKGSCPRLEIHHMVDFTEDGEAYVRLSRLVELRIGKKDEEV